MSSSFAGMPAFPTVRQAYDARIERGEIERDPAQEAVVTRLDRLVAEIAEKRLASKSSSLGWLFARKKRPEPVRGLYLHGGVGRGKTMLMDLFFGVVPVKRKRRAHFNAFMTDVHDRIGRHRAAVKAGTAPKSGKGGDDPIPPVADELANEAWVLCFDEFSVTDIADAMILSRLFSALFERGVVLIATSNVAPVDLYKDGLNRGLFLPFVKTLEANTDVVALDAPTDYRQLKLSRMPVYLQPLGPEADRAMDEAWATATEGHGEAALELSLMGRKIAVPRASGTAARFTFAELCDAPLGARDYLALAARFDTFFIDRVPILDQTRRNPAKRFILLIDTLYDGHKRLFMSADAPPDELYAGRPGVTEAFEFARTASRLVEMQSRDWLEGSLPQETRSAAAN